MMARLLIPLILLILTSQLQHCAEHHDTLFQSMSPESTGVTFSNNLTTSDTLTVLDFENIYNGGGVAIGDINNDGLQDIYFTANMVSSRLYLNKGNFHFEDITEKAGVSTSIWANGVTLVDINQDGFKDIYICAGGSRNTPERKRKNLLFINNRNSSFTESAQSYGLTGIGNTVQAAFFDYDLDGDLDVYLLRNAFVEYSRNRARPKATKGESNTTDQLYRNNGDLTFTDISANAGISIEGFGLGVQVCDLNDDQWPDIFVSNDFITNDLLYLNNKDGTFTNRVGECMKHQTYNAMGNDIADFNNDGLVDLVEVDMLPEDNARWKVTMVGNTYDVFENNLKYGYEPQYIRNTLQLNNGNGTFSDIGYLAGVEATDWSWAPLFGDYNNDGFKDLFITNGYRQDITNLDFIKFSGRASQMGTTEGNRKEKLDMLNTIPGIKVHNYLFKNNGDLTFSDNSVQWGSAEPSYSNGAAYADLDNDGDLDLVINNLDESATLLRNTSVNNKENHAFNFLRIAFVGPPLNKEGIGARVYLKYKGKIQYQYFTPFRGFLSSVEPFLHFGVNELPSIDSVEVIWPNGKYQLLTNVKANQVLTLNYSDASTKPSPLSKSANAIVFKPAPSLSGLNFKHRENDYVDFRIQPTLPHMHSRNGPGITVGDINGDSLEDFYVGGATNHSGGLFIQESAGSFKKLDVGVTDSLSEDMGVLFFDADNDNDLDLYIASGGSEHAKQSIALRDHFYLNDGKAMFTNNPDAIPDFTESGSAIIASDYDRDGDLDLFVGSRLIPGEYPLRPSSYILKNESFQGKCRFIDVTSSIAPDLQRAGMVTSALWTDYDNDGWIDLIVAGEFMPISFFHNERGKFVNMTNSTGLASTSGWWNSLTSGDFDHDGDTDYLAGNLGLNSRYQGTPNEPLCIYAKDFDNTGSIDPVVSMYIQGKKHVAHSWDDLVKQMNVIRTRFRTYQPYAKATFEKSFLESELSSAYTVCSERFESSYIENLGGGKLRIKALPLLTQVAPIYGIITDDFDHDGNLDALLVGNSYSTEVSTGRYDAFIGVYLRGDGNGNFVVVPVNKSGFFVDGDAKGLAALRLNNGQQVILAANNSGNLKAHVTGKEGKYFRATRDDSYAIITLKNGKTYKHEFYYGSTYLSQSSRTITINDKIDSVIVYDFKGKKRNGWVK